MQPKLIAILLVLFCSAIASFGQILLKMGSENAGNNPLTWITNIKLIAGLAIYGFASIIFIYALKLGNVSMLYPIIATSYIWVAILASVFLGEHFGIWQWAGIGLILLGVGFIIR